MVDAFAVGRRVKVVAPDPYDTMLDAAVGDRGVIVSKCVVDRYAWEVDLEGLGYPLYFTEGELQLVDVRIIEGVVRYDDTHGWLVGDSPLDNICVDHEGKRVRITIETI